VGGRNFSEPAEKSEPREKKERMFRRILLEGVKAERVNDIDHTKGKKKPNRNMEITRDETQTRSPPGTLEHEGKRNQKGMTRLK